MLWWKRRDPKPLTDKQIESLLRVETRMAARLRRIRDGQDLEFEQMTIHLRNKHF